jgi:hypothetical protein
MPQVEAWLAAAGFAIQEDAERQRLELSSFGAPDEPLSRCREQRGYRG